MKIRLLSISLLVLLGVVGCAHQPVSRGGTAEDALGGAVEAQFSGAQTPLEAPYPDPAASGMAPYQEILSYPGLF